MWRRGTGALCIERQICLYLCAGVGGFFVCYAKLGPEITFVLEMCSAAVIDTASAEKRDR